MTEKNLAVVWRDFRVSTIFAFYLWDGDPRSQRTSPGPECFLKGWPPEGPEPRCHRCSSPTEGQERGYSQVFHREKVCWGQAWWQSAAGTYRTEPFRNLKNDDVHYAYVETSMLFKTISDCSATLHPAPHIHPDTTLETTVWDGNTREPVQHRAWHFSGLWWGQKSQLSVWCFKCWGHRICKHPTFG